MTPDRSLDRDTCTAPNDKYQAKRAVLERAETNCCLTQVSLETLENVRHPFIIGLNAARD